MTEPLDPPFREGWPSLPISAAASHFRDNRRFAQWLDGYAELWGEMLVTKLDQETIEIVFSVRPRHWEYEGFELQYTRKPAGRLKPDIRCKACRQFVASLYHAKVWKCADCHGLVSRHSLLTRDERRVVQTEKLIRSVHFRKQPVTNFPRHDNQRWRLAAALEKMDETGVHQLPPHLNLRLSLVWSQEPVFSDQKAQDIRSAGPATAANFKTVGPIILLREPGQ